jgi:membrane-associated PAP2 superfamily phosphatase
VNVYLWPLLGLALITPLTPFLDLSISNYFYTPAAGFASTPFYNFLYHYGFLPADLTAVAALLLFILSFFKWRRWRAPALAMALTLLVGSGIIVHVVLKDHWGRPRPKQIVEFGGQQSYRPYYMPDLFAQKESSKSFPCGHCSTGFYFFCLVFIGRQEKNPYLVWCGMLLALTLGILLSLARIAQGGHFFSDVLVSALIMWITAAFCTSLAYRKFGVG